MEKKKSLASGERMMAAAAATSRDSKAIRRINPVGMRVVVRLIKDSNQTESGLYLPEGSKQALAESVMAEVVEVATAQETHSEDETNVSGIPLGAIVLVKKDTGCRIPWDDELRILETKEVLAIVDEMIIS
jgi:co-chaperonin GroES (HSP10)